MALPLALTGIAMLLLAQEGMPSSSRLWVDAPDQLSCPDEAALLTALRVRLGNDRVARGTARSQGHSLFLIPSASRGVTITLRKAGAVIGQREIEVGGEECTALAHTIALMVEAWLATPSLPPKAKAAASGRLKRPTSEPAPVIASGESVAGPAPAKPPEAPALPSPAVPAPVATAASPIGSAPQAPPWSVVAAVGAGAMAELATPAALGATAEADLRVEYRRWFVGVRGGLESAADLDPSAGQVRARRIPVNARFGRILVEGNRASFATLVGVGIDVMLAHTSGYGRDRSFATVVPVVLVGAQGEWRLRRHLGVVAAADVLVASRRVQFVVTNAGSVARTPRARAGLTLGVAWHFQ